MYEIAANYETLANALNRRAGEGDRSYASESAATTPPIMGDGPIAIAGQAGVEVEIPDVATYPSFRRGAGL